MHYEVKFSAERDQEAIKIIGQGIMDYNSSKTGGRQAHWVTITAKDDDGTLIGGMYGYEWLDWIYVDVLWVDEKHRKTGIGRKVMEQVEQTARERNWVGIHLDTMSFQAKEFYEKQDYTIFGVLDNYPGDGKRYFFQKRVGG